MDKEAFKVLLEAQERTQRSAMDLVVKTFQERTKVLEDNAKELVKSLDFAHAEILDLKRDVKVFQKSDIEKQVMIEVLQSKVAELQQRVNYQEDYNRRSNIRISGLLEQPGESWEQTASCVTKLLKDKLQLPQVDLERAHRVGAPTTTHPRVIVARFEKYSQREAALRNAKKLRGTGIYLNEDLCPASIEVKKKKIPLMKKAKQEGKIAFFRHTKLIIKERTEQHTSSEHHKPTQRDSVASETAEDGSGTEESVERPAGSSTAASRSQKSGSPHIEAVKQNAGGSVLEGAVFTDAAQPSSTGTREKKASRQPGGESGTPSTRPNTRERKRK